jgi:hypothetical protein
VIISRWTLPYEEYGNTAAYLLIPVIIFTNCEFSNNQGEGAGAVEIKGQPTIFGFNQCIFKNNTFLTSTSLPIGSINKNDVVISSYGV